MATPRSPSSGDHQTDDKGHAGAVERCDVLLQLLPDHREVGDGGVEHALLKLGIVAQEPAENGDQDEQKREDRHERVVRQQRGHASALVVVELP